MENNKGTFPATVVHVIDDAKVVINRGSVDEVKLGQRFLIYAVSKDPIIDPENGDVLGHLEIVRGTGKVVHLQERMATLVSDMKAPTSRTVRRFNSAIAILQGQREEEIVTPGEPAPFDGPTRGDKAKPI